MQQRLLKDIKCIHDNVYKPFTNLSLQPTICLRLNSLWLGMCDLQQLEKCGMSITQISTCRPRWSKASSHLPITMPTRFRAISHHDTKLYANDQNHYTFVSINETFNSIICHLFTKQNNHTKNINFQHSRLEKREAWIRISDVLHRGTAEIGQLQTFSTILSYRNKYTFLLYLQYRNLLDFSSVSHSWVSTGESDEWHIVTYRFIKK